MLIFSVNQNVYQAVIFQMQLRYIFGLVGGKVLDVRKKDKANTENTCALKVSIALNRTNIIILNIPGQTIEGGGELNVISLMRITISCRLIISMSGY